MSVINTNVKAIIAQNALKVNNRSLTDAMQQLSTGQRINGAKDDAAGLAISQKMTAQIRGLNQAIRNANDGISLVQTAEGALVEVTNMMQRMRELAVQSANDTNTPDDRAYLDAEFQQLKSEINRIGNNTQWNGVNLLDNSFAGSTGKYVFQVGANANQVIDITIEDFRTTGGTNGTATVSTTLTKSTQTVTMTIDDEGATKTFADGDKIEFTINGQKAVFNVTTTNVGDGEAKTIAAAIAADDNMKLLKDTLGVTVAASGNQVTFTGAAGAIFTFAETETVASGATTSTLTAFSPRVQTSEILVDGSYKLGDKITFTANGTDVTYTVAGSTAVNDIATALKAAIDSQIGAGKALENVTSGLAANKVTLTGGSNVTFTASSAVEGTDGLLSNIHGSEIIDRQKSDLAISALDVAIKAVNEERATMGATINRLSYAADNLASVSQNTSAARSRILDTDYAATTTELAKTQIIQQAATAMLAQANQQPQAVLSLLQ